jgi:hypothetical protein
MLANIVSVVAFHNIVYKTKSIVHTNRQLALQNLVQKIEFEIEKLFNSY